MRVSGILRKRNELLPSAHCPSIWTDTSQNANIIKRIFTYNSSQSCSSSHIHYALHNICLSLRKWYQLFGSFTQWKAPSSTIANFSLSYGKGPYSGRRVPRLEFHCNTTLLHFKWCHSHSQAVTFHEMDFLISTLIPQNFMSCAFINYY